MSNYSQIPLSIPAPGKFGGLDGTQSSNTVTENMMDKSFDDDKYPSFRKGGVNGCVAAIKDSSQVRN